jgi:hypothetical protein
MVTIGIWPRDVECGGRAKRRPRFGWKSRTWIVRSGPFEAKRRRRFALPAHSIAPTYPRLLVALRAQSQTFFQSDTFCHLGDTFCHAIQGDMANCIYGCRGSIAIA